MQRLKEPHLHIYADVHATASGLADWLADATHETLRTHNPASWAVSGGNTPVLLFKALAANPERIPWESLRLFLVDERDVQPSDPLSNYRTLEDTLLDHLKRPPIRTYPWATGSRPPEALALYRQALQELDKVDGLPVLDIALMGMGGDGHTASVFPGSPQLSSTDWVAYGPGPNANRYTLSLPLLANTRHVVFLVTGSDKAARVKDCIQGQEPRLPAARLSADAKDVHWFLDQDSARDL